MNSKDIILSIANGVQPMNARCSTFVTLCRKKADELEAIETQEVRSEDASGSVRPVDVEIICTNRAMYNEVVEQYKTRINVKDYGSR